MRKLLAQELIIKAIVADSEAEISKSEVLLKESPTGKTVSGAVLEAAFKWNDYYLLFMTDDIPQEDMLSIHFLDKNLNLLDSATIGSIYSTGSFTLLEFEESDTVAFRFIGDTEWRVELSARPVLGLPYFSDPKGVQRKLGFKRYFKIYGEPVSESAS